jgi:predicted nucleotidyltransferase
MRGKRAEVAREAARLLYYGFVEEYKDAKTKAAETLGTSTLPSNFEVALELDQISDQVEGSERELLIPRLRKEALELMTLLSEFHPKLIGSVWRGTARKGSDIDIQLYSSTKSDVLRKLIGKYRVKKEEWVSKTSNGETNRFYHMLVPLEDGAEAEISVTDPERIGERRKDAVYEDDITGLGVLELRSVLRDDPLRRFVPEKKKG